MGELTPNAGFELVAVDRLRVHPENQRKGDVGALTESIGALGFYSVMLVQVPRGRRKYGRILAGEHRWYAAKEDGPNEVPVWWLDVDDDQARRILIADNRTSDLAGWDEFGLRDELEALAATDQGLAGTGFDGDDLDELRAQLEAAERGWSEPRDAPPLPEDTITVSGDLWLLGDHRLLCGDATDPEVIERVMDGERTPLIYTDPPYGVEYTGGTKPREALAGDTDDAARGWYDAVFAAAAAVGSKQRAVLCWYLGWRGEIIHDARRAAGWETRAEIVWVKNQAQFGSRIHYKRQHEGLLYCVQPSHTPKWNGPANETTVWNADRASVNEHHPTQKPVEIGERAITNHSDAGDTILDLYGGSGSALIAADRTSRRGYLVEIEKAYCDVICRRFEEHTGVLPVLEATGEARSFAEPGD